MPISATDQPQLLAELASIRRRLAWLTTALFVVAMALLFFIAAVLAYEIEFHAGESILIAGACVGGSLVGFLFGWLARRTV